jgi:hypothetical protein
MIWPAKKQGGIYYAAVKVVSVFSDEAEGELFVSVTANGEAHEIVYTGMYYSQLDNSCAGLTLTAISETTPEDLKQPKHSVAAVKLMNDCNADDDFLKQMLSRGNRLYMHYTEDGSQYIVLAKRMKFD